MLPDYSRYSQVCPFIYGKGTVSRVGKEVKRLGCSKVLLVAGKTVSKLATYQRCKKSLQEAGIGVVEFNENQPEPPDHIIDKGENLPARKRWTGLWP